MNKAMLYGSWAIIISSGILYAFSTFYSTFYCKPRSFIWNKLQAGKCRKNEPLIIFTAAFNIVVDAAMLLLPTLSLWKLQIDTKKKIQITCMFGMGILYVLLHTILFAVASYLISF